MKRKHALGKKLMLFLLAAVVGVVFVLPAVFLIGFRVTHPWKVNTHYPSEDLPWNGPDSRPVEQYRETLDLGSTTGKSYAHRWHSSLLHKPDGNHYGRIIDGYLDRLDGFGTWPGAGSMWLGGEVIYLQKAPYEFTFLSIQPVIVFMVPHDSTSATGPEVRRFVSSRLLDNTYYYGTSLAYHPELQWFAPELERGPEPLGLAPGQTKTIAWDGGRLILTEKDGRLHARRE